MVSLVFVNQLYAICAGSLFVILGVTGSVIQIFLFTTVPYYRKTPCTFYFLIGAVHEFCLFVAAFSPVVFAAFMSVDLTRVSVVWCKLRFFFGISCTTISSTCACFAAIDQFLVTSQQVQFRQWSNLKRAHRASILIVIIWWIHSLPWLYYQDLSPITGFCYYQSEQFRTYAILFFCFIVCGMPIFIMSIFGILAYRNIRNTSLPLRLRFDRQMITIVFVQILLNIVGLGPFCIYSVYGSITLNLRKDPERILKESLTANITYLFASIAFGGRFFLFMLASSRFRSIVKEKILRWKRPQQIQPILK